MQTSPQLECTSARVEQTESTHAWPMPPLGWPQVASNSVASFKDPASASSSGSTEVACICSTFVQPGPTKEFLHFSPNQGRLYACELCRQLSLSFPLSGARGSYLLTAHTTNACAETAVAWLSSKVCLARKLADWKRP